MASEQQLLDVTDRTRRLLQHGAIFAGVVVLLFAKAAAEGDLTLALSLIACGLALFGAAATIKQKWAVTYRGHDVRYENSPLLGEKLLIDNKLVGKGKIGFRSETRGVIRSGNGAGDTIIARTEAGFFSFRCRITAQAAETAGAVPSAVSDEQLLAEVRRRGLTRDF